VFPNPFPRAGDSPSFEMAFHYELTMELSPLDNDLCHQVYPEGAAGIFKVCAGVFPVFRGLTHAKLHIQLVSTFPIFLAVPKQLFDSI